MAVILSYDRHTAVGLGVCVPHTFDFFWSENRTDKLMSGLNPIARAIGVNPEEIPNLLARWIDGQYQKDLTPSEATCRRIMAKGVKPRKKFRSGLLIGLVRALEERSDDSAITSPPIAELRQLYRDFVKECYGSAESNTTQRDAVENTPQKMMETLRIVGSFLHIDLDRFSGIEPLLFREGDGQHIYFDTFRFSSKAGFVNKSFTVFHRPATKLPIVRFVNFIDHKGRTRESRGIVLPFRNQLVLIGHADKGKGVKMLMLPDIEGPQDEYLGMMTTTEPEGTAVSARTILVRSDNENHKQAKAAQYALDELNIRDRTYAEQIRNRIKFVLENSLFDSNGKPLDQKAIVRLIDRYLHDGEDYKITDSSGNLFNPAADDHYTYNSALKLFD